MLISIITKEGGEIVIESDVALKDGDKVRHGAIDLLEISEVEYAIKDGHLTQIAYVCDSYTPNYENL